MEQTAIPLNLEDRVRWYTKMRWFYLIPLAVAGIAPLYITSGFSEDFRRQLLLLIVAILVNFAFFFGGHSRKRRPGFYIFLGGAQIAFDILLATWVLYQNGGIESRSVIIYAIPIIMTGALFGRLAVYLS